MMMLSQDKADAQDALRVEGYHMLRRRKQRKALYLSLIPIGIVMGLGVIYFGAIWWIT